MYVFSVANITGGEEIATGSLPKDFHQSLLRRNLLQLLKILALISLV
jgi:hypothetical protein